jgi:hypothetical protein
MDDVIPELHGYSGLKPFASSVEGGKKLEYYTFWRWNVWLCVVGNRSGSFDRCRRTWTGYSGVLVLEEEMGK